MKKLSTFLFVSFLILSFCQVGWGQTTLNKSHLNNSIASIDTVTIAEARKDDNHDLIPDYSVTGDTLMLTGVLTTDSLSTSSTTYFMQDATGGIQIFYYGSLPATSFKMGDSVFVIGTISQYHGLDEIEPLTLDASNFGLLKHNAMMPKPMHVTLHQYVMNPENYEGMLIEVDTLYKASGTWPSTSGSIYLTNAGKTDTAQMYINGATNIGGTTEPMYPVNVVGVGSQYSSSSSVVNNGYEIVPRSTADIKSSYLVTIAEARKDDNHDLVPDYSVSGDTLMITGVITSPSLSTSSETFFIQDKTGGIEIYYNGPIPLQLPIEMPKMGDSVYVVGTIAQYHGLDEIEPLSFDSTHFGILKHNAMMPKPMHVMLHQYVMNPENYEGMLIEVDTLYKASGTWPSTSGSIYLTNAGKTDTAQMYINGATNIGGTTKPIYPINIVGVASQYSSGSTVTTGGYEIVPRSTADIKSSYLITIAEARKDTNNDLVPDYSVSGDTVMITGVLTTDSLSTTGNATYFVQDATDGIQIFYYGGMPTTNFVMGDSVFVIGTIDQYRGLDEIVPLTLDSTNFGLLKHNVMIPKPMLVTLHQYVMNPENYEGMLIEIDSLYKASGTWPAAAGSGSSIYLTDAGKVDTAQMYINSATDIGGTTEPKYPINIVGVASQYSSGASVTTGGYEIVPPDSVDIKPIIIVGVKEAQERVYTFSLYQNYPNPFNPTTTIKFEVPSAEKVELSVYDVLGRKIKTLYNSIAPAGVTTLNFDASNLASGVYIYTIRTAAKTISKKLMLLK